MSDRLSKLVPELRADPAEIEAVLDIVRFGTRDGSPPVRELVVALERATPGAFNRITKTLAVPLAITESVQAATIGRRTRQAELALRAYSSRVHGYRDEDGNGWRAIACADVIKHSEMVDFLDPEQDDEVRDTLIDLFLGHTLSVKKALELPRFVRGYAVGLESFRQDRAKAKKGQYTYARTASPWEMLRGDFEYEPGTNPVESLRYAARSNAELSVLVAVPEAIQAQLDRAIETNDIERLGICWAAISKLAVLGGPADVAELAKMYKPTVAARLEDPFMRRVGLMQHEACPNWIYELSINEVLGKNELSVLTDDGRPATHDRQLIKYHLGVAMQSYFKTAAAIMPGNPEFGMSVAALIYAKDIDSDCDYQVTSADIEWLKLAKAKRKRGVQIRLPRRAAGLYAALDRGDLG